MRLILLFLTASLIFAQDNDDAINALTQTIVGLDQSGIEQLNTSLAQENAGLSLTNSNATTAASSSTTQENQTTQQVTPADNNQSTNNSDSVSQTTSVSQTSSVSNTDSTSPTMETSDLVSVDETNSTSATQETTEEQICLVPYIPWSEGLFFLSEYKGDDPRIAKIMEKWEAPIEFYYKFGIGTLPTELNKELMDSGIEVVYDKSQEELMTDMESGQCGAADQDEDLSRTNDTNSSDTDESSQSSTEISSDASPRGTPLESVEPEDVPVLKDI